MVPQVAWSAPRVPATGCEAFGRVGGLLEEPYSIPQREFQMELQVELHVHTHISEAPVCDLKTGQRPGLMGIHPPSLACLDKSKADTRALAE